MRVVLVKKSELSWIRDAELSAEVSRCTSPRDIDSRIYRMERPIQAAYLITTRQSIHCAFEDDVTSLSGRIFARVEVT